MTQTTAWNHFLDSPKFEPGHHAVQFFENDSYLAEIVSRHIAEGLRQGEAVVIIATAAHIDAFQNELEADLDLSGPILSEQLVFLDAEETLARFMVDGMPDWELFLQAIGSLLERMASKHSRIRAYGEMVDLLRAEGNLDGMIRLEELWNDLARIYSFSLLCGYGIRGFAQESDLAAFERVCGRHTHVLPAETYSAISDQDGRNRAIAELQRKAAVLERELEKKRLSEAELRESEARLQAAIRARDEFLSIASHELKTPLTALILQTQLKKHKIVKGDLAVLQPASIVDFVDSTNRQLGRLGRLIDDMLDISRIAYGTLVLERSRMDLGLLVRDVLGGLAQEIAGSGSELRISVESAIEGEWDRSRIEQVVSNLISNAIKYGKGKPIEVAVTLHEGVAKLVVTDQGIGISKESLVRVFERFERAISANDVSGLGLGLYICRQIVEAHRGRIWGESELGQGSTFAVELPLTVT